MVRPTSERSVERTPGAAGIAARGRTVAARPPPAARRRCRIDRERVRGWLRRRAGR